MAPLLVVLGCGKPTAMDGSSEEAFERSTERATADLSPEEKEQFEEALLVIGLVIAFEVEDLGPDANPEDATRRMLDLLDGKSVDEVIEIGKRLSRESEYVEWD